MNIFCTPRAAHIRAMTSPVNVRPRSDNRFSEKPESGGPKTQNHLVYSSVATVVAVSSWIGTATHQRVNASAITTRALSTLVCPTADFGVMVSTYTAKSSPLRPFSSDLIIF